jgi:hypothetical protein
LLPRPIYVNRILTGERGSELLPGLSVGLDQVLQLLLLLGSPTLPGLGQQPPVTAVAHLLGSVCHVLLYFSPRHILDANQFQKPLVLLRRPDALLPLVPRRQQLIP